MPSSSGDSVTKRKRSGGTFTEAKPLRKHYADPDFLAGRSADERLRLLIHKSGGNPAVLDSALETTARAEALADAGRHQLLPTAAGRALPPRPGRLRLQPGGVREQLLDRDGSEGRPGHVHIQAIGEIVFIRKGFLYQKHIQRRD